MDGISGRNAGHACRVAILLAIIGVFGTWSSSYPVSLNGVEGSHNGWLVIIYGLIALSGVRSLSRGGWLGIVTVLGSAAIMLYTPVSDLLADRSIGESSGWGIWLTMVMSGILATIAIVAAVERIRGNTPAGATTSSSSRS